MMAEPGRGLVRVGAARLDLALEHLLKAVMAPSADPEEKLFTPDRSLGSYGAKMSLAARLGPIDLAVIDPSMVARGRGRGRRVKPAVTNRSSTTERSTSTARRS
ncbi:MAG: hypothetical protein ACK59A_13530 [Cyanobacteriota bacterium]